MDAAAADAEAEAEPLPLTVADVVEAALPPDGTRLFPSPERDRARGIASSTPIAPLRLLPLSDGTGVEVREVTLLLSDGKAIAALMTGMSSGESEALPVLPLVLAEGVDAEADAANRVLLSRGLLLPPALTLSPRERRLGLARLKIQGGSDGAVRARELG